jgi:NADPH2:quinone reductase
MRNRRVIVTRHGGPDSLQVVEEDCPEPKNGNVRVKVLAAGVSLPDVLMREGIHPETRKVPYTPGWDFVGVVDRLGPGVSGIERGQLVAALPIVGSYTEFICLPKDELVPVPSGLDPAEAVALILNYVTAYQMMHRTARVKKGERVLIHGAAGGVGTALLQLGRIAGVEMYGTCSARQASAVSQMAAVPIDYENTDFVQEIRRLTGDGVNFVFEGIGGRNIWRSRNALRRGGKVIEFGLTGSLRGGRLTSGRRSRFHGMGHFVMYVLGGLLLPGRKRVVPYSIQTLKRLKPAMFREDLTALFHLLEHQKIRPVIAERFPLVEARRAHEVLGRGGVTGKLVLVNEIAAA